MTKPHVWCVLDKEGQTARVHLSEHVAHLSMLNFTTAIPQYAPYRIARATLIFEADVNGNRSVRNET